MPSGGRKNTTCNTQTNIYHMKTIHMKTKHHLRPFEDFWPRQRCRQTRFISSHNHKKDNNQYTTKTTRTARKFKLYGSPAARDFFFNFIYLFIYLQRGREGEKEKHPYVVASHMLPTGFLAHNPGMCPNWEWNQ